MDAQVLKIWLKLLRPHQYIKNTFVLIGILFSHHWDMLSIVQAAWAFCAFSATASAVYVLNDIVDRNADRAHPTKCTRPLASGAVSVQAAFKCLFGLLGFAFLPSMLAGQGWLVLILLIYLVMNIIYSFSWKHIVLVDVFVISAGFMLRILAGTVGLGIEPSEWLLLCSMMLTLFLGFSKRTSELLQSEAAGNFQQQTRKVLNEYSPVLLAQLTSITAACTIISYGLYTVAGTTVQIHGTNRLIYTLPFVIYGIFRYLYLTQRHAKGTDTARDLLSDRHLLVTAVMWVACTFGILV